MTDFKVLRPHEGDRFYKVGEIRSGNKAELKHLVPNTLEEIGAGEKVEPKAPKAKVEPAAKNKDAGSSPKNKGKGKGNK